MSLREMFSCYVSHHYRGNKQVFPPILQFFEDTNRYGESKAIFAKGKSFVFTFDYEAPELEVRAIVRYCEKDGTITVSVGNSGLPFEVKRSKPRYQRLLNQIDTYIQQRRSMWNEEKPQAKLPIAIKNFPVHRENTIFPSAIALYQIRIAKTRKIHAR